MSSKKKKGKKKKGKKAPDSRNADVQALEKEISKKGESILPPDGSALSWCVANQTPLTSHRGEGGHIQRIIEGHRNELLGPRFPPPIGSLSYDQFHLYTSRLAEVQAGVTKKEADLKKRALMYSGLFGRSKTQQQANKNRKEYEKYRKLHQECSMNMEVVDKYIREFQALPDYKALMAAIDEQYIKKPAIENGREVTSLVKKSEYVRESYGATNFEELVEAEKAHLESKGKGSAGKDSNGKGHGEIQEDEEEAPMSFEELLQQEKQHQEKEKQLQEQLEEKEKQQEEKERRQQQEADDLVNAMYPPPPPQ